MEEAETLRMIEIIRRYQKPAAESYGSCDERCRNDSLSALHREATASLSLLGVNKLYNDAVRLSTIDVT